MKRELKRKWIKALLSGRYKQGTSQLQNSDGTNCCLGVLCRVARIPREGDRFKFGSEFDICELPRSYLDEIKITSGDQIHLIAMNDKEEASFKEIATWIRKNL